MFKFSVEKKSSPDRDLVAFSSLGAILTRFPQKGKHYRPQTTFDL